MHILFTAEVILEQSRDVHGTIMIHLAMIPRIKQ